MELLTANAVQRLSVEQESHGYHPWVQVIDIKKIKPSSGSGTDRYRVVLSDGKYFISGMLATQLTEFMESGQIQMNSLIQLQEYISNDIQQRRIIIILSIGAVKPYHERIGTPQNSESGATTSAPHQPAPQHPQSHQAPPKQPLSYQQATPTPSYNSSHNQNRGPVVYDDPGVRVSDIESLNPYAGGRWTIKARVTNRTPVKEWSNARGSGKLCSVELLDAKGGEIRATMFNDAVDKYFELLRPSGIFYISGGKIKVANRKYTSINNDYEITFDNSTDIRPAPEDASIQQAHFNFHKIADIENLPADANIDVLGIVKEVGDVAEITTKAGKLIHKRDLVLVDDTSSEIKVTLWNERATQDCSAWSNAVLALRSCRVSEFNGRSIGTFSSTQFNVNPDIPEAGALMNWFTTGGKQAKTKSLSTTSGFGGGGMGPFEERLNIVDIKDKDLGLGQKPDYLTVKGMINFIKHDNNVWYQACPKCQKKVIQDVHQKYLCEKCQTTFDVCENRYIMSATLQDHSGSTWASCFNEQGKTILGGKSADEMSEMQAMNPQAYEAIFKDAMFRDYVFRLRVKAENVQEELRVKTSVVNLEPINYVSESRDLIENILKYN